MAGLTRGTFVNMTITALESLAADNTAGGGITGWSSAAIDCGSLQDVMLSVKIVSGGTARQAGTVDIFVYGSYSSTDVWPDIFSSGTEGSQGAVTVHDQELFGTALKFVTSLAFDNGTGDTGAISQEGIAKFFGSIIPSAVAFFIRHNISTTTTTTGISTGNLVGYYPVSAS